MNIRTLICFSFLMTGTGAFSQLVYTDPVVPITNQPVTVYYDASLGSGGLAGYTGDVYAHTGVITDQSSGGSDWKYVKTEWGQFVELSLHPAHHNSL